MNEPVEHALRFGSAGHLVGILSRPAQPRPGAPACLLFNSGVVHRIGPHRLNVRLARALAQRGIATLRLDLAGQGDSSTSPSASNSSDQAVADLRDGMALLERELGCRRFIVFGLCSGARHGYRLALADERVAGLLMYDGYTYPTLRMHLNRRWARLRDAGWRGLARKAVQWLRGGRRPKAARVEVPAEAAQPTPEAFRQAMDSLVDRGTAVYTIESGSFIEHFNYAGQWRDRFGSARFVEQGRHEYRPDLDHTLTTRDGQRTLTEALVAWVDDLASHRSGTRRAD